ncbi:SAV_2336 N-terminal domain-related protein [Streptomyces syringium]|uniref:SAV_2336 N-terminal domain-related protein n=1 Tax=Streptomyces syringium TaxID=76729 RepID=UPI0034197B5B
MGGNGRRAPSAVRAAEEAWEDTAAEEPLTGLVARLREAGLEPRAEELADALWLSQWVPAASGVSPVARNAADSGRPTPAGPADGADDGPAARTPAGPTAEELASPAPVPLYAPGARGEARPAGPGDTGAHTVRVPVPSTLPDGPALRRALRPLRHHGAAGAPALRVLDEIATAHRMAESRTLVPEFRIVERGNARIALVMDVSSSNSVWEETLHELKQVCVQAGAFREIALHYLHEDPWGLPGLAGTLAAGSGIPRLGSPGRLTDPTGRTLVLVLSDCTGPMWRAGHMQRLLYRLSGSGPVAVLQPLPQRMWARTHLPPEAGTLTRHPGPAGRLGFLPRKTSRAHMPGARGARPVPVLAPRHDSVGAWTRLVVDSAGCSVPGAAALVHADHPPAPTPAAAPFVPPAERLRRFRATAAPDALELAVLLSAAPLVLPVMQLVQRAALPHSGPDALAEVLLSGLLQRTGGASGRDGFHYEFVPGVREELLGVLSTQEARQVLGHLSGYVERRYGRGGRNFPALASAALSGSVAPEQIHALRANGGPGEAGSFDGFEGGAVNTDVFAKVSAQVLRHFGRCPAASPDDRTSPRVPAADLAAQAHDHLDRFRRLGILHHLDAAVRALGAAVRTERVPAARAGYCAELADALATRWSFRPLVEDLREALYAAEGAVPLVPSARLTLARVLERMADEAVAGRIDRRLLPAWTRTLMDAQRAGGPDEPDEGRRIAAALLAGATGHLTDPAARAGGATGAGRAAVLARIRLLRRLAVAGAPYAPGRPEAWCGAHLRDALEDADMLLADGPVDGDRLVRGAVLLDLARHHSDAGLLPGHRGDADPDVCRAYAARAAEDLCAAGDEPSWEALPVEERCRTLLDHADALVLARSGAEPDDGIRSRVRCLLAEARQLAGDPSDASAPDHARLAVECLLSRARILTCWCATAPGEEGAHGDEAITAWSAALPLLATDDPRLPAACAALGEQLTARAARSGSAADRAAAARTLRRAVAVSAPGDPGTPWRQVLLARSLAAFADGTERRGLHEADAALRAALSGLPTASVEVAAWQLRGDIAVRLGDPRTAAHRYGRAARRALQQGTSRQWFEVARAQAAALEAAGQVERALDIYVRLSAALQGGMARVCGPQEADSTVREAARLRAVCGSEGEERV